MKVKGVKISAKAVRILTTKKGKETRTKTKTKARKLTNEMNKLLKATGYKKRVKFKKDGKMYKFVVRR